MVIATVPPKPSEQTYDFMAISKRELQTIERALRLDNPDPDLIEYDDNMDLWDQIVSYMTERSIERLPRYTS